jgi:hypothetical protein
MPQRYGARQQRQFCFFAALAVAGDFAWTPPVPQTFPDPQIEPFLDLSPLVLLSLPLTKC